MALLTEAEREALMKKGFGYAGVKSKCDRCGKPLVTMLTFLGTAKQGERPTEYCSRVCFDAAESGSYKNLDLAETSEEGKKKVINKGLRKVGEDDDPKPSKKAKASDEDESPKKSKKLKNKKKAKAEPEEPPKKSKSAKAEKSSKKAKGDKPKKAKKEDDGKPKPLYRPDSSFGQVYARLATGKGYTMESLFKGIEFADPKRLIAHMTAKGVETGRFKITNTEGTLKMKVKS